MLRPEYENNLGILITIRESEIESWAQNSQGVIIQKWTDV